MTAKEIFQYMVRNGACPSEVMVCGNEVSFDIREVPEKSYTELPFSIIHKFFGVVVAP